MNPKGSHSSIERYDRPTLRQKAHRDDRWILCRFGRDHLRQGDEDPHLEDTAAARHGAVPNTSANARASAGGRADRVAHDPDGRKCRGGEPEAPPKAEAPKTKLLEVKSPMVGTYYTAPEPGAKPYVAVGSRIAKGQILCIIEAMKIMNEIESEFDGRREGSRAFRTRTPSSTDRCSSGSIRMANPTVAQEHDAAAAQQRAAFNFKAILQQMVQLNASDLASEGRSSADAARQRRPLAAAAARAAPRGPARRWRRR